MLMFYILKRAHWNKWTKLSVTLNILLLKWEDSINGVGSKENTFALESSKYYSRIWKMVNTLRKQPNHSLVYPTVVMVWFTVSPPPPLPHPTCLPVFISSTLSRGCWEYLISKLFSKNQNQVLKVLRHVAMSSKCPMQLTDTMMFLTWLILSESDVFSVYIRIRLESFWLGLSNAQTPKLSELWTVSIEDWKIHWSVCGPSTH